MNFLALLLLLAVMLEAVGVGNPIEMAAMLGAMFKRCLRHTAIEKPAGEHVFRGAIEEDAVHSLAGDLDTK